MTSSTGAVLLDAFVAALLVEDAMRGPTLQGATGEIRTVIETLRAMTNGPIKAAIAAPAYSLRRVELLQLAVDFDKYDSPLVARCAQAHADALTIPTA